MTWQELIKSARNEQAEEEEDQPGASRKAGREELRTQKPNWPKRTRGEETPLGSETKHKKSKKKKQLNI